MREEDHMVLCTMVITEAPYEREEAHPALKFALTSLLTDARYWTAASDKITVF